MKKKTLEDYENKICYLYFRENNQYTLISEIAEGYLNEKEMGEYQKLLDEV